MSVNFDYILLYLCYNIVISFYMYVILIYICQCLLIFVDIIFKFLCHQKNLKEKKVVKYGFI